MSTPPMVRLSVLAAQRWGLFTTSQADEVGVDRNQLARMTASGVLERVIHGVYRIAGAPVQENELTYATWLALGGVNYEPGRVPPVVAAGVTFVDQVTWRVNRLTGTAGHRIPRTLGGSP